MFNRYLTFYKPAIQFVVFCAILSMSWLIGGSLVEVLNVKLTGLSTDAINDLKDYTPALADQLKVINGLLLLITLFLPAMLFAYLAYPSPLRYLGLTLPEKRWFIILGPVLMILALPFTSLLEEWSRLIPAIGNSTELDEQYNRLAGAMLQGDRLRDLMINILFMSLLPALIEEVFFRGCLQQIMCNWMRRTPIAAIVLVAILFSAFHGQLSGFFPRLYLGLILGLAYHYTGSLWVPVLMHFVNNFITILFTYFYKIHLTEIDPSAMPDTNLWLGLASGVAVVGMLFLFYRNRQAFQPVEIDKDEFTDEQTTNYE